MRKHLKIRALGIAAVALAAAIPTHVLASGFYAPWWAEALMFLMWEPAGWVCLGLIAAVLVALPAWLWKRGPK